MTVEQTGFPDRFAYGVEREREKNSSTVFGTSNRKDGTAVTGYGDRCRWNKRGKAVL